MATKLANKPGQVIFNSMTEELLNKNNEIASLKRTNARLGKALWNTVEKYLFCEACPVKNCDQVNRENCISKRVKEIMAEV